MAPRLDSDHLTLDLSVADLLDARMLRHLGFANRGGYERLWLGQAIHSRYQEQAIRDDPTYQREVSLVAEFDHRGWRVRLQGRADGLRRDGDGARVVEEIKSVRRDGRLAPAVLEIYQRQAALYAWMLQQAEEGEAAAEIRAELILIEIGSDSVERLPVEVGEEALELLEKSIRRRLNGILRMHREEEKARERRRAAAEILTFPFAELRRGQQEIFDAVATALDQGEHLLLEAPTGLGKTAATLYPTLRHCLAHGKRVYVLTAKTLQQEMAMAVLELLNQDDAYHSLRLRAKAKMCANDQVVCHEDYCDFARDYYQKVQQSHVLETILGRATTVEPDTIYALARKAEVCPFEVSLELSGRVQITVCDYNYAFDPYVALTDFARDADLSDTVLVVDEIHNLLPRGRGYYSPELGAEPALEAADSMLRLGRAPGWEIADLCRDLARIIEDAAEDVLPEVGRSSDDFGQDQAVEAALPEDRLWALRPEMDAAFIDYLEYQRETKSFRDDDPFVRLYFDFLRFLNGLVISKGETFSHCIERRHGSRQSDGGVWLRILCKDPSRYLGEVINRCASVIGLSATLSPPDLYRDLLGFDRERTASLALPSPFPAENRRIVIDASVGTAYRERPKNYQPIAERLAAFSEGVPGNCLALFPSYQFLAEVSGRMPVGGKRVLVQQRADGDREREEILHTLRSAVLGDVLLLAVAGGVFAEGVDYPGDVLKAVAVVGPCLPALSLEQQLLRTYYDERFDRGFEYAFIVPGMTRVVQAAGRLIRSPEDTGVIALLDHRFLQTQYRRHLPHHWVPEDGIRELVGDPARIADQFFAKPSTESGVGIDGASKQ